MTNFILVPSPELYDFEIKSQLIQTFFNVLMVGKVHAFVFFCIPLYRYCF